MGTSASSGTVRNYLAAHAEPADAGRQTDLRRLPADEHQRQHAAADGRRADGADADADRGGHLGGAGIAYRRPDSDDAGNRFRLYEVAGMPHNNSRDSPGFHNDPCTLPVTDFPAGAFTALGLNHLIEWIADGKTPPHAPPIAVDQDPRTTARTLALDELGNAKGGIRNVWVDVPIATYGVFGKGKTTAQDRLCQLAGTKVPLADEVLRKLYRNKADYVAKRRAAAEAAHRGRLVPAGVRGHGARRRESGKSSLTVNSD